MNTIKECFEKILVNKLAYRMKKNKQLRSTTEDFSVVQKEGDKDKKC